MKFTTEEFYGKLTADNGKLIYRKDEESISLHKELLVPSDWTEEYCREHYAEILESAVRKTGTVYTKLAIRRACRAVGLEAKLDELLNSNPAFKSDWTDAQEIDLADPYTAEAMKNFTDAEYKSILAELTANS